MSPDQDHISLHALGLTARVGVPDVERATPQRLEADLTLWPHQDFAGLNDDLARTVDYDAAAKLVRRHASAGEWKLIETLGGELCAALLAAFPLAAVRLTLRKFILPDTAAVAVTLTRRRTPAASVST